ncbi:hypothetical protein [Chelatococcus asaccharovorans]|uniref:Methyltransferase family protein n=1 Tax=Chelatococcus asaccharovorans TaxID=28210 RepID=A0A2V3UAU4_9HYPH|nr:hypothetical protein [Chelatococcus asaccharovorans]PXW61605.1 hypothetical protein C7450_103122 [Chelatococcus asaccharovorans]
MVARGATYERAERDFYVTPAWVTEVVASQHAFRPVIWEPACGNGAIMEALGKRGHTVYGSDIEPVGIPQAKRLNFLTEACPWPIDADIVTNPPYGRQGRIAEAFIHRALEYTRGHMGSVAMLLAVDFDSAKTRARFFREHPAFCRKIVLTRRIVWIERDGASPSQNHAWFVWNWRSSGQKLLSYGG